MRHNKIVLVGLMVMMSLASHAFELNDKSAVAVVGDTMQMEPVAKTALRRSVLIWS